MSGILYGVGVGPGDPELLTLKAVRLIRECGLIAVPDGRTGEQTALTIAREFVADKPLLSLHLPMVRDEGELARHRERAADQICEALDSGTDVVFLTLGDSTVYSTYTYLHKLVAARGYPAKFVPGVPSFCAAAAALETPLCEGGQPLHIIPASYRQAEDALDYSGVKVLMKSGKKLEATLQTLKEKNLLGKSMLAERVGMEGERLVKDLEAATPSGYFCVIIVKED